MSRGATVCLAVLTVILGLSLGATVAADKASGLEIGKRFFPFNVTDVNTEKTLCYVWAYGGRPTIMTWGKVGDANWAREVQFLEKLYKAKKNAGLTVFAVALDTDKAAVKAFGEENGLTFPIAVDVSNGAKSYNVTKGCTTMLGDRGNKVVFNGVGLTDEGKKTLGKKVDEILSEG